MAKNELFDLIAAQDTPEARTTAIANLASLRKVSVEALTAEFDAYAAKNAANLEKARRKAAIEALNSEAGSMTLDSENLADFVGRVVAEKGSVTLNPDLTLSVSLPTARRGGGGGKPKADQPRPYVDAEGNRILGAVTDWLDANYTEEEQQEAGLFRPNGKRRAGQNLVEYAVRAGFLVRSPIPTEDSEAE